MQGLDMFLYIPKHCKCLGSGILASIQYEEGPTAKCSSTFPQDSEGYLELGLQFKPTSNSD